MAWEWMNHSSRPRKRRFLIRHELAVTGPRSLLEAAEQVVVDHVARDAGIERIADARLRFNSAGGRESMPPRITAAG